MNGINELSTGAPVVSDLQKGINRFRARTHSRELIPKETMLANVGQQPVATTNKMVRTGSASSSMKFPPKPPSKTNSNGKPPIHPRTKESRESLRNESMVQVLPANSDELPGRRLSTISRNSQDLVERKSVEAKEKTDVAKDATQITAKQAIACCHLGILSTQSAQSLLKQYLNKQPKFSKAWALHKPIHESSDDDQGVQLLILSSNTETTLSPKGEKVTKIKGWSTPKFDLQKKETELQAEIKILLDDPTVAPPLMNLKMEQIAAGKIFHTFPSEFQLGFSENSILMEIFKSSTPGGFGILFKNSELMEFAIRDQDQVIIYSIGTEGLRLKPTCKSVQSVYDNKKSEEFIENESFNSLLEFLIAYDIYSKCNKNLLQNILSLKGDNDPSCNARVAEAFRNQPAGSFLIYKQIDYLSKEKLYVVVKEKGNATSFEIETILKDREKFPSLDAFIKSKQDLFKVALIEN